MPRRAGTRALSAAVMLALGLAGCGSPEGSSPAGRATPVASAAAPATGLGGSCAAQWAAAVSTYAGDDPSSRDGPILPVVLLSRDGLEPPAVEPVTATLVTDRGPIELAVNAVSSDPDDSAWGTTQIELALPVLDPGIYRAQFLDLGDGVGTWRFRVGEYVITVLADGPPDDLEWTGGTGATAAFGDGSLRTFEIRLRNATDEPIEVTGAATDIPGVPVAWDLIAFDPVRTVPVVPIAADARATLTVGTETALEPVPFVLASPEVVYRVGGGPEQRARFFPVAFTNGFGDASVLSAYRASLPPDACAEEQA